MIGLKMMGVEFRQVVDAVVISRCNGCGHGQGSFLSFIQKRAIHHTPSLLRLLKSSVSPTSIQQRLKREDIQYIDHDSSFTQWKILIGGSDWKEHAAGKEGAERYRTQNLPNYTSAGVYELGIATSASGRGPRKIEPFSVVPVYHGQAENVRCRLQMYGRHGAHLEKALLFSHIFSTDFPIAYRWAPMKSKEEAERREEELLGKYDYAWNKRNNGDRRPHDIYIRLNLTLTLTHKTSLLSILRYFALRFFQFGYKNKINSPQFWR